MVEMSQYIIEVTNQKERKSLRKVVKDALGRVHTIGKRKEAVARVFLDKGKGKITINNMELLPYFTRQELVNIAIKPLSITKNEKKFAASLKRGDRIITKSGMYGKVFEIIDKDDICIIETQAGKIKFDRQAISMDLTEKLKKPKA